MLTFRYAIEILAEFELEEIISALETDLNLYLANTLLPCYGDAPSRQLQEDFGIVAFDSFPEDEASSRSFCGPRDAKNICLVVDGAMQAMLNEVADPDKARFHIRSAIRDYMNGIPSLEGIVLSTYISPAILDPTTLRQSAGRSTSQDTANNSSAVSNESIVLFALAGAAIAGSVGIALWFGIGRRNRKKEASEGKMTVIHEIAHINTMDTCEEPELISPFSAMLPSAYRLDSPSIHTRGSHRSNGGDMSIILETEENDHDSSGILISEGYTTDSDEMDISSLMGMSRVNQSQDHGLLGAVRWEEQTDPILEFGLETDHHV